MSTRIVNVKSGEKGDVYIGRPGPFGNPYVLGQDGDRAEVIRLYRAYFYGRLKIDPAWKLKVEALRGRVLVCHCKPLDCHGDVIVEYLDMPRSSNG
jgi:hypothetical protein